MGTNASLFVECIFLEEQPGIIATSPSDPDLCIAIVTLSPEFPVGSGPLAAQYTAASRFSVASVDPLSEERWDPVMTILPGAFFPFPQKAKESAAEVMCNVSVP